MRFCGPLVQRRCLATIQLCVVHRSSKAVTTFVKLDGSYVRVLFIHPGTRKRNCNDQLIRFTVQGGQVCGMSMGRRGTTTLKFCLRVKFRAANHSTLSTANGSFPVLRLRVPPVQLQGTALRSVSLLETLFARDIRGAYSTSCGELRVRT